MRKVKWLVVVLLLLLAVLDKTEDKIAVVGNWCRRREVRRKRWVAGSSAAVHGGGNWGFKE